MDKAFRHLDASSDFGELLDTTSYSPLPDDWLIGITDVVDSTSAIARGQFKDVNYAVASAIAALGNAFGNFDFPFVFRGDGAAFAFDPDVRETAVGVLRRVAGYARDHLQLKLRIGLVERHPCRRKRCESRALRRVRDGNIRHVRRRRAELGRPGDQSGKSRAPAVRGIRNA